MINRLALVLLAMLISCGSLKNDDNKLPCIDKKNDAFTLRWGDYEAESESYFGYQMDIYGELSFYTKSKSKPEKAEILIKLETAEACQALDLANRTAVSTQALYSPATDGSKSRFVQYTLPEANTFIMAVWNPKFETQGSVSYRALFDSLQKLIPSAKQIR